MTFRRDGGSIQILIFITYLIYLITEHRFLHGQHVLTLTTPISFSLSLPHCLLTLNSLYPAQQTLLGETLRYFAKKFDLQN